MSVVAYMATHGGMVEWFVDLGMRLLRHKS